MIDFSSPDGLIGHSPRTDVEPPGRTVQFLFGTQDPDARTADVVGRGEAADGYRDADGEDADYQWPDAL